MLPGEGNTRTGDPQGGTGPRWGRAGVPAEEEVTHCPMVPRGGS